MNLDIELDPGEILRYMGQKGEDKEITLLAQKAAEEIKSVITPRYTLACYPLDVFPLEGRDIRRHVAGCSKAYLLAATLGAGTDAFIRTWEQRSMLTALALDAAASEAIEKLCDKIEQEIKEPYLTGRYSPGYGDWPLSVQPRLAALAAADKKIGLTVTGSGLLTPRKSVTALLGAYPDKESYEAFRGGKRRGCGGCMMNQTCPYRKAGKTCGF